MLKCNSSQANLYNITMWKPVVERPCKMKCWNSSRQRPIHTTWEQYPRAFMPRKPLDPWVRRHVRLLGQAGRGAAGAYVPACASLNTCLREAHDQADRGIKSAQESECTEEKKYKKIFNAWNSLTISWHLFYRQQSSCRWCVSARDLHCGRGMH